MTPDPNIIFLVTDCKTITHVRPTVRNPNIIVGDFTYFRDTDFEKHVLHHYDFNGDKLIIGKFCQIASGVTFIMNGANHQMNAASTYPLLTDSNIEYVKMTLKNIINGSQQFGACSSTGKNG